MTRRSTDSVSFQRLIILACGFIAWPVAGIAQDDILGELISDQETQTTQTDDNNQPGEAEVVERATTVAPEDGTDSEVVAGAEVNQELATDESVGDAGEADRAVHDGGALARAADVVVEESGRHRALQRRVHQSADRGWRSDHLERAPRVADGGAQGGGRPPGRRRQGR
mgnify:CR=1 FL=1